MSKTTPAENRDVFDRVVRVRIGPGSLPATELGLDADGSQTFEPITPIRAVTVAPDGSFHVDLVRSFTSTTTNNRVESVEVVREANGAWLTVLPDLQRVASFWGWTEAVVSATVDVDVATPEVTATFLIGQPGR